MGHRRNSLTKGRKTDFLAWKSLARTLNLFHSAFNWWVRWNVLLSINILPTIGNSCFCPRTSFYLTIQLIQKKLHGPYKLWTRSKYLELETGNKKKLDQRFPVICYFVIIFFYYGILFIATSFDSYFYHVWTNCYMSFQI